MAVYGVVKFTAKPDKMAEARAATLELAEYANEKYYGTPEVLVNVDGIVNQIYWLIRYESMAEWEKSAEQRAQDNEWQALLSKGREFFDGDNAEWSFYRVIS